MEPDPGFPDWPACLKHGEGQEVVVHGQIVCGPCFIEEEKADAWNE